MLGLRPIVRKLVNSQVRDSLWALRTRGDMAVLSAVARGTFRIGHKVDSDQSHLRATMDWLCAAQDATGAGGVSAFYDVREGVWAPPYPETTGYIIPTFFDYASYSGIGEYRERAISMADWLLPLQLPSGAFPIGPLWPEWERAPLIFDTGQIIHGLVRAFEETTQIAYLEAATRAGRWLVEVQDKDGSWPRFTPLDYANAYNTRTAWALLRLYQVVREDAFRSSAVGNLSWVMAQQAQDGWFSNMGFTPDEDPLTHTVAYTIEGLLESGIMLQDSKLIHVAQVAADKLRERQDEDGFLRARYGPGWQSHLKWSCLTGNAQMAIIWLRLHELTNERSYVRAADLATQYVKQTQARTAKLAGVAGGIAGSYPIYGDYEPYRNLNWAAKFFVDSLLLQERLTTRLSGEEN